MGRGIFRTCIRIHLLRPRRPPKAHQSTKAPSTLADGAGRLGWARDDQVTRRFRVWIASATIPLGLAAMCVTSFEERVVDASPPGDPWMKAIGDLNGDSKPDLEPDGALLSLTSLGVLAHLCARRRRRQQQCVAGSPSVPITAIMASAAKGLRWRAMPPGDFLGNGGGRSDPARLPCMLVAVRYPDRASRRERLERELARILTRIVDADTERVILFGSAARGDVKSTSDLDLLVVRRDARRPAERAADLYRRAQPSLAVDILVYTPEELDAARETSSFIRRILREGRVVHDRSRAVA